MHVQGVHALCLHAAYIARGIKQKRKTTSNAENICIHIRILLAVDSGVRLTFICLDLMSFIRDCPWQPFCYSARKAEEKEIFEIKNLTHRP